MKYIAFESTDKGIEIIAEIDCDKITGKDADAIRELLQSLGFPDKKPDMLLHASRLE